MNFIVCGFVGGKMHYLLTTDIFITKLYFSGSFNDVLFKNIYLKDRLFLGSYC